MSDKRLQQIVKKNRKQYLPVFLVVTEVQQQLFKIHYFFPQHLHNFSLILLYLFGNFPSISSTSSFHSYTPPGFHTSGQSRMVAYRRSFSRLLSTGTKTSQSDIRGRNR